MTHPDFSSATHAYVGVAPCGCRGAAHVIAKGDERDTARFVADLIRRGWEVEKVPLPGVRIQMCVHDPKWKASGQTAFDLELE